MFLGEYQHTLDDKGRVVLPSKYRDALAGGCVITKGQERCLFVFPMDRWQDEMAKVNRLPRTDPRARKMARAFFAGASDQKLDRQGRIVVPDALRSYASLDRDVTIAGMGDFIEIWSKPVWEQVGPEADEYYAGIEEVLDGGEGI